MSNKIQRAAFILIMTVHGVYNSNGSAAAISSVSGFVSREACMDAAKVWLTHTNKSLYGHKATAVCVATGETKP